jgi:hypothetical protein
MRHRLTPLLLVLGFAGLLLAVGMPCYQQVNKHTSGLHPDGWIQDERRTHPFAVTGAGFAVFSGLCFLSATIASNNRRAPE